MADLFLSYASEDEARARIMAAALAEHGWSVFWDRTISAGQTWRGVIGAELEQARAVVVLWSKISVTKHWVIEEADRALKKKHLIPVMIDDVAQPLGFGGVQAAELFNWDGSRESPDFQKLLKDIERLLGSIPKSERPAATIPPVPSTAATNVTVESESDPRVTDTPQSSPAPKRKSFFRLDHAIVALVVAAVVGGLWFFSERKQSREKVDKDVVVVEPHKEIPTPPPIEPSADDNRREKIERLLERADAALEAQRLSRPSGDNALEYYRAALELDPDNSAAQRGLDRIMERFITLARHAYEERDTASADDYLRQADQIQPDNAQVQRLMKLNERLKATSDTSANRLQLASISPRQGRPLKGTDAVSFKLDLNYRLASADRALLMVGTRIYPHSEGACTGTFRHTREETRIPIAAHDNEVTVSLSHQAFPEGGYLSFYAYFWDADAFEHGDKVLISEFKEFNDYCYEITPRTAAIDIGTSGRTVLLGTWSWDIESDRMTSGTRADVWWQHTTSSERYLTPKNGAQLALLGNVDFDAIDLTTLRRARYSDKQLSGSDSRPVLNHGTVIALKTAEGNYAKIKVLRYRSSHDFNFKEAEQLKTEWRNMVSGRPQMPNYHLEIQWTLFTP